MPTEVKTKRVQSSNSFVSVIISWLGIAEGFQTLEQSTLCKLETEIKEVLELLNDDLI